jgi:hypothetical protein
MFAEILFGKRQAAFPDGAGFVHDREQLRGRLGLGCSLGRGVRIGARNRRHQHRGHESADDQGQGNLH